ncbi:carbohydrate porin [Phenylobacterium sp.]|uniref:carbohydrate porin n=1 Tax=Phenylobacterium sp. TaxID=1871053 RepID=UPI002FC9E395
MIAQLSLSGFRVVAHRIIGAVGALFALGTTASAEETPAVQLSATYTGEAWRNLYGGLRSGSAYLENLEAAAEVDMERAFGWRGATVRVSAFWNDDDTLSERLVGDTQAVSGKDATGGTRLYETWVRQAIGGGAVKLGVIDLNSDLALNKAALLFVNGAQGLGLDLAQIGRNGPSVFPNTGLGVLAELPIDGHWEVKIGAFDGVPRNLDGPPGPTFRIGADDGALIVAELLHESDNETRLALGLWSHTAKFDAMGGAVERDSSMGGYALVERPLARWGDQRLDGFVRLGLAEPKTEEIAAAYSAGLVLSGRLLGLEDEALGVAFTTAQTSRPYRRARAALGAPVDKHETAVELTYRAQVTPWLAVQPDVQYVINPGADPALKNALVVGLRFEMAWSGPSGR